MLVIIQFHSNMHGPYNIQFNKNQPGHTKVTLKMRPCPGKSRGPTIFM
jgi:hypothetical protein